ncbi:hypothetical protein HMPREF9520_01210 [Enterococcus faecalis TX1467]|nr:hypothetical protein HMPREF9520_01210 [Enterococcus faecalis TX1467]
MKLNGIIMIAVVGSVLSSCGWQKSKEESQKVQTVQTNNVNTEETRVISATEVSQTTALLKLEQTTQTHELTELVTEEGTIWNRVKSKTVRTIHGNLGSRTQSELSNVPTRSLCSFLHDSSA